MCLTKWPSIIKFKSQAKSSSYQPINKSSRLVLLRDHKQSRTKIKF